MQKVLSWLPCRQFKATAGIKHNAIHGLQGERLSLRHDAGLRLVGDIVSARMATASMRWLGQALGLSIMQTQTIEYAH